MTKLLVFAHVPPPLHGQSAMVAAMVDGLRGDPEFDVVHVNPQLSRDAADIGTWRPGKFFRVLGACVRALALRARHGPRYFYYVPAPAKRGALYRDWVVMLLCRPFFSGLVLHWHAVGLGEWLRTEASAPERWITRALLGRAQLAIVLDTALRADAEVLMPRQVAVVANGIPDPLRSARVDKPRSPRREVLYVGLCSREKGILDALAAVGAMAVQEPGNIHLTVAGSFADAQTEREFRDGMAALPHGSVEYAGPVGGDVKAGLFARADVFCFPTQYRFEGQPLTLIEAMAHDVPLVTTRWRAIPNMLPSGGVAFAEHGQPASIAAAITAVHEKPSPGVLRAHYLAHFTIERHLSTLRSALRSLP